MAASAAVRETVAPCSAPAEAAVETETPAGPPIRWFRLSSQRTAVLAAVAAMVVSIAVAVAMLRPEKITAGGLTTIAVMPMTDAGNDPLAARMAAEVSGRLTDGLARIENLRVLLPDAKNSAHFVVSGELQKSDNAWTVRARMTGAGEVKWTTTYTVNLNEGTDLQLQQSRLAAGVGHSLALRINELLDAGQRSTVTTGQALAGQGKVAIEQATAHINHTTKERFQAAQDMLEKALADDPGNVDIQAALAALLMRGVQMVWISPAERDMVEARTERLLLQTLSARPTHIPTLEAYCRFLTATNQFRASLVACARALSFDPWNGIALYHVGLTQIRTGRFEEALATFEQADRFNTPQVSRWTWLIGAGWANLMMGRAEDAVPWLQKSLAITAASGRTHMLLAAAYQQLGRFDEAKAAMAKGRELRPGSTVLNVPPPAKNSSANYLEASERIMRAMAAAGLPES